VIIKGRALSAIQAVGWPGSSVFQEEGASHARGCRVHSALGGTGRKLLKTKPSKSLRGAGTALFSFLLIILKKWNLTLWSWKPLESLFGVEMEE
jgi:hypothetical protein